MKSYLKIISVVIGIYILLCTSLANAGRVL